MNALPRTPSPSATPGRWCRRSATSTPTSRAVNRVPLLTQEEETEFARRLRDNGDLDAAGRLVVSHLRLVVSISRKYLGYGLPHGDLIQEGNIGLMKAVKRFDPDQGVRLVSYAMHWIKAEIHEYILKNWRMVKVATTKAQRKLFFNLRSMKQSLKDDAGDEDTHRATLTQGEVDIARREPQRQARGSARDGNPPLGRRRRARAAERRRRGELRADRLPGRRRQRADAGASRRRTATGSPRDGIALALDSLDARSRRIVEERWLKVNDDSSGGMTLHDLAGEYGVSAERIRQIEVAAMKKMRKALAHAA